MESKSSYQLTPHHLNYSNKINNVFHNQYGSYCIKVYNEPHLTAGENRWQELCWFVCLQSIWNADQQCVSWPSDKPTVVLVLSVVRTDRHDYFG